ncbi:MAG: hypothetical protein RJB09_1310, partial [Pseudomonadota bacterium]
IKVGHKVEISDASRPERKRSAEVTRMTGEIDSKSRTMLIERSRYRGGSGEFA